MLCLAQIHILALLRADSCPYDVMKQHEDTWYGLQVKLTRFHWSFQLVAQCLRAILQPTMCKNSRSWTVRINWSICATCCPKRKSRSTSNCSPRLLPSLLLSSPLSENGGGQGFGQTSLIRKRTLRIFVHVSKTKQSRTKGAAKWDGISVRF